MALSAKKKKRTKNKKFTGRGRGRGYFTEQHLKMTKSRY